MKKKEKPTKPMYALYVKVFFPPPPLQKTPAKHSRSPDITVVFKVNRSPFDFLCTTAVWHKQKTRVEFNFRPDRGWFHGVADRYIVLWTKQTGSDVTKWKRRFHWAVARRLWNSILTHLSKKCHISLWLKLYSSFFWSTCLSSVMVFSCHFPFLKKNEEWEERYCILTRVIPFGSFFFF